MGTTNGMYGWLLVKIVNDTLDGGSPTIEIVNSTVYLKQDEFNRALLTVLIDELVATTVEPSNYSLIEELRDSISNAYKGIVVEGPVCAGKYEIRKTRMKV